MPQLLSYALRSLWARRTTTLATAGGIALLVFVLAACELLSPKQQAECPPAPAPVGRYQLLQGTVQATYKNSERNEPTVFRIDTVTGKVSQFVKYYDEKKDKVSEFWTVEQD